MRSVAAEDRRSMAGGGRRREVGGRLATHEWEAGAWAVRGSREAIMG